MRKGGRRLGLKTLPPSCTDCLEIWVPLKLLEPSGSVQACIGIALPLPLPLHFNTNLLHNTFTCWLMLRHVSTLTVDHLHGAFFPWRQPIVKVETYRSINPLNAELNPICHLLTLLGGATIVVVSRLRVNQHAKVTCKFVLYFTHDTAQSCVQATGVEAAGEQASRPALRPGQPFIQWIPWVLSLGFKRPGSCTDSSPIFCEEVRNALHSFNDLTSNRLIKCSKNVSWFCRSNVGWSKGGHNLYNGGFWNWEI